jgi:hypothetical protein
VSCRIGARRSHAPSKSAPALANDMGRPGGLHDTDRLESHIASKQGFNTEATENTERKQVDALRAVLDHTPARSA